MKKLPCSLKHSMKLFIYFNSYFASKFHNYKMKFDILTEKIFSCQIYSNVLFYLQLIIVKYYNSKLLFSILIYTFISVMQSYIFNITFIKLIQIYNITVLLYF